MTQIITALTILTALLFSSGEACAQEKPFLDHFKIVDAFSLVYDRSSQSYGMGVKVSFFNDSQTQKIDYDNNVAFQMTDEFGNSYRQLPPPSDTLASVNKKPASFPSFYPGDESESVLFFEPPVSKAQMLQLTISRGNGSTERRMIRLPEQALTRKQDMTTSDSTAPLVVAPTGISVEGLESGTVLEQGQVTKFTVRVSGGRLPQRITVLAFNQTLEDNAPAETNVYDLNVPLDQPLGDSMLNVIAQWGEGSGATVSSAQINLSVTDVIPSDVL